MMDSVNQQQIRALLEETVSPAVSIYMPTHRGGAEARQDRIRLKNAIVLAKQELVARGRSDRESDAFLGPCRKLLEDGSFWLAMADGLAIFLSPKGLHYFRLPYSFQDQVVVADTIHIKPLIPFLNRTGDYYLLALSEQNVRLLRGNSYGLQETTVAGLPRSFKEVFNYDQPEQQLQWHTRTSQASMAKAAMRQAMFHGNGGGANTNKQDRERFIQVIDRRLNRVLTDKSIPLMLAAVDHSIATFQGVSSYPMLMSQHVQGNPDHWDESELWRRSWPLVEPELLRTREGALKQCQEQAHSDLGGHTFEKVTPRAYEGRVDVLVVAVDRVQYGIFDPRTLDVFLHDEPRPDNLELLEFTAQHTILNGGSVYGVNSQDIPGGSWLLATFRY